MELHTYITEQETHLLVLALRALQHDAVDVANGLERTYGSTDGRVREAWTKALARQQEISALGKKLGVAV